MNPSPQVQPSNFNPRSPWGERPGCFCSDAPTLSHFNPRSPWGERPLRQTTTCRRSRFQSTLPVGGATKNRQSVLPSPSISIHAPRGGSDKSIIFSASCLVDFNPRSPWGERQALARQLKEAWHFNPRSPWGERLFIDWRCALDGNISIHAPRGGSDPAAL